MPALRGEVGWQRNGRQALRRTAARDSPRQVTGKNWANVFEISVSCADGTVVGAGQVHRTLTFEAVV